MKLFPILLFTLLLLIGHLSAQQNVGVNTTSPQANLHVNGTFRLEKGVLVNGISADSTLSPGSDSLLPTQLAIKKYLQRGLFAPADDPTDSLLIVQDSIGIVPSSLFGVGQYLYVTSQNTNSLYILDISNPEAISIVSSTSVNIDDPSMIKVVDGIAYVANFTLGNNCLSLYNVTDPHHIIPLDFTSENLAFAFSLEVVNHIAYVTSNTNAPRLSTFDVSDPANIIFLNSINGPLQSKINSVRVYGNIAYVVSNEGRLTLINVSNPAAMSVLSTTTTNLTTLATDVLVMGNYAYVSSPLNNRLCIYDVSNPSVITAQGFTSQGINFPDFMAMMDEKIIINSVYNGSLCLFDISTPGQPKFVNATYGFGGVNLRFNTQENQVYSRSWLGTNPVTVLEWSKLLRHRTLTLQPDGTTKFELSPWLLDSVGNVYKLTNNVGIGTDSPSASLHLSGNMKVDQKHTIEFGAGINGKQQDAGKIGYTTFSNDALDIVGAGPENNRKIKFYADGGSTFYGNLSVENGNLFVSNGYLGINNSSPEAPLHLSGAMKIDGNNTLEFGAGVSGKDEEAGKIGYQTYSGKALDIVGAGPTNNRKIRFYAEGGSDFEGKISTSDSLIVNGTSRLNGNLLVNEGWVGIGNVSPTAPLHLSGKMKIDSNYTLEFGAGFPGKNQDAGKIGYGTFSGSALDIVGAGPTGNRKVTIYAEGGTNFQGKITTTDSLVVNGKTRFRKLIVQDSLIVTAPTKLNGNLLVNNGWLGIGNSTPSVPLHLSGLMKIDGNNSLEFGAGVAGKQSDAGKIGYTLYSNALDIIGAGSNNQRRIKLWAEAGVNVEGKLFVTDSIKSTHSSFSGNGFYYGNLVVNGNVGVGTNPSYKLDVNGRLRIRHASQTSGIFFDNSNNSETGFVGMYNDNIMGFYGNTLGSWNLVMNTTTGAVGIGTINPNAALDLNGDQKVQSAHYIEFGSTLTKHPDAGKIGYGTFTPNVLDIVGAGTTQGSRVVKIWDKLNVEKIHVDNIETEGWHETSSLMQNGWADYANGFATGAYMKDPYGFVRLRGTIGGGSIAPGTLLFTLPASYRPSYGKLIFMVPNNTGFARLEIHPNGNVFFFGSSNVFLSLDQITFKVD